jgi:hypothetical protein
VVQFNHRGVSPLRNATEDLHGAGTSGMARTMALVTCIAGLGFRSGIGIDTDKIVNICKREVSNEQKRCNLLCETA